MTRTRLIGGGGGGGGGGEKHFASISKGKTFVTRRESSSRYG
jgi:hypothetical protein